MWRWKVGRTERTDAKQREKQMGKDEEKREEEAVLKLCALRRVGELKQIFLACSC